MIFIGLAALNLFLFNDLFDKIEIVHSDIIDAIQDATPLMLPVQTPPPVACPACPACSVENAEKWRNLLAMKNFIPQGQYRMLKTFVSIIKNISQSSIRCQSLVHLFGDRM